jgi:hypothetical protein
MLKIIAPVGFFIGLIIGVLMKKLVWGVFIGLLLSGLLLALGIVINKNEENQL